MADQEKPIYDALAVPDDGLEKGGVEVLRAAMIEDGLFVSARRTFDDPGVWGEVLGDITRRIAQLYAAEGRYTHKDALAAISGAFAADLGAPVIAAPRKPRASARKTTKRKPARAKTARAKTAARRKARR